MVNLVAASWGKWVFQRECSNYKSRVKWCKINVMVYHKSAVAKERGHYSRGSIEAESKKGMFSVVYPDKVYEVIIFNVVYIFVSKYYFLNT